MIAKLLKSGDRMGVGRPKSEIQRMERLHLRLSKNEFEELLRAAEKYNITKTEAVVRGIKMLLNPPQQRKIKVWDGKQHPGKKNSEGITYED